MFAGSATVSAREELDTYNDGDESWIGGYYPVSYSFTLLDFPVVPGMQCHIFLVPTSFLPAGINPTGNEDMEYLCSNNLWVQINGAGANPNGSSGYNVNVSWKTNNPNANPNIVALNYTNTGNQSPVGTWTLQFNAASTGTLTPPGVAAMPFTITDPNVAADFASPVMACFGLQPNSKAGIGTYIDYAKISITGTANPISENFTNEPAYITSISGSSSSGYWDTSDSANPASVVLVTPNDPLWVIWNLPDTGFGLGVTPILPVLPANLGNQEGNIGGFVLPAQYNGYGDWPVTASRVGGTNWTLIPSDCLPSYEYPWATNAFFELINPPPAN